MSHLRFTEEQLANYQRKFGAAPAEQQKQEPKQQSKPEKAKAPAQTGSEHEEQAAFFEWWAQYAPTVGINERLFFAIPNGGQRHPAVAAKMKAEGVKKGVCDAFLSVPRGPFHGLYLEFKVGKNTPSEEQHEFLYEVRVHGYMALVVYSAAEAIEIVKRYVTIVPRGRSTQETVELLKNSRI